MTALEALQSVQFVTVEGRHLAVMDRSDWELLVEWLEDLEDLQTARQAYRVLKEAGGDREKAGWLRWDGVEEAESAEAQSQPSGWPPGVYEATAGHGKASRWCVKRNALEIEDDCDTDPNP